MGRRPVNVGEQAYSGGERAAQPCPRSRVRNLGENPTPDVRVDGWAPGSSGVRNARQNHAPAWQRWGQVPSTVAAAQAKSSTSRNSCLAPRCVDALPCDPCFVQCCSLSARTISFPVWEIPPPSKRPPLRASRRRQTGCTCTRCPVFRTSYRVADRVCCCVSHSPASPAEHTPHWTGLDRREYLTLHRRGCKLDAASLSPSANLAQYLRSGKESNLTWRTLSRHAQGVSRPRAVAIAQAESRQVTTTYLKITSTVRPKLRGRTSVLGFVLRRWHPAGSSVHSTAYAYRVNTRG